MSGRIGPLGRSPRLPTPGSVDSVGSAVGWAESRRARPWCTGSLDRWSTRRRVPDPVAAAGPPTPHSHIAGTFRPGFPRLPSQGWNRRPVKGLGLGVGHPSTPNHRAPCSPGSGRHGAGAAVRPDSRAASLAASGPAGRRRKAGWSGGGPRGAPHASGNLGGVAAGPCRSPGVAGGQRGSLGRPGRGDSGWPMGNTRAGACGLGAPGSLGTRASGPRPGGCRGATTARDTLSRELSREYVRRCRV